MDASQLTYERHSRAVYVDYRTRQLETEDRNRRGTTRPVESISPVGGDGPDYTNWYNYIITGPLNIDDCTLACIPKTPLPPVPPPPPPIPSQYTYFVIEDPPPNWTWRIYNIATSTWGDSIDSGYAVSDYSIDYAKLSNGFLVTFNGESDIINVVVGVDGTVLQTFVMGDGTYFGNVPSLSPIVYVRTVGDIVSISLYNMATNTFSSPTPFTVTTNLEGGQFLILDNAILFGIINNETGDGLVYSWGVTQTEPTLVFSVPFAFGTVTAFSLYQSGLYGPTFNNALVIISFSTGIIYIIAQDGTFATYDTGITTYTGGNANMYGDGNLQMCYMNIYNPDTDRNDVYVFPFATTYPPDATFTPVTITGLNDPQFAFKCVGPIVPTDGSNHLVILDYSGVDYFVSGNVYVVFNGTQKVGPLYFNGSPNTVLNSPLINKDGVCLFVWNGSQLYSQVITPSINVTTLIPNLTNDWSIENTSSMLGYFPIYGSGDAENGNFLCIVSSTTGALIYSNIPTITGKTYIYDGLNNGSNLYAYDYTHNKLLLFINGTATEIPWANFNNLYVVPEIADGTKFTSNILAAPNNSQVLSMNATGYTITTIPYSFINMNNITASISFYNLWSFLAVTPCVTIGTVDNNGNLYTYKNVTLTGYSFQLFLITNNTLMWWLIAGGGTPQFYIEFNTDTNTYDSGFSDSGSNIAMLTNYPYGVGG